LHHCGGKPHPKLEKFTTGLTAEVIWVILKYLEHRNDEKYMMKIFFDRKCSDDGMEHTIQQPTSDTHSSYPR